ncbi:DNA polymerase III subunit beta [Bailinhaonella thermotolerans]|uniref:Beta sliding clamp n=1 Tax=Bailinhaonella thermotolerans TaxID=1070861 RepID=A0A3A4AQS7_9ACTN|nr:DNA polymerase III subunit beta [Bailinhaonella thermotolerans]RJL32106.1 DNA polymerase III subunit beta [Bailinhaonella thermotolerans]
MRILAQRDEFADAVAWTARGLPTRPSIPVLAAMMLDVADGRLTLSSFDYEVSAQAGLDVGAEEPGRVLVPGRLLAEIVRSLPQSDVRLATEGAELVVTCGGAEFGLPTMPVEDYPTLPTMPERAGVLEGDVFARAVSQVVAAASRDDTLPMLTGVRLDIDGGLLTLACTDRYRLAVRRLTWKPEDPGLKAGAMVPARVMAETARSLRSGVEVSLALSASGAEGVIGIEGGTRRTTSRLLDDHFIDYENHLPREWTGKAEVATAPFIEAIKRAALVAERTTPIRLDFTEGEVRVQAGGGTSARAHETLEARLHGGPVRLGFNPQFLLDGLAGIDTETTELNYTSPTRGVLFTTPPAADDPVPAFRYLVQPVRLSP